ncbi:transport protein trapp [Anaeramoeba flamelloides]|uniref:Transport protein trapp n=1 Tax=Anaeramoeba flamelloides TaxID=1746091 RepID=A0AAV7YE89_9EUKA|nr:transport protein trapp [Anaeramoeba flamelloides]
MNYKNAPPCFDLNLESHKRWVEKQFSPLIITTCSKDAKQVCKRNGLKFNDLLSSCKLDPVQFCFETGRRSKISNFSVRYMSINKLKKLQSSNVNKKLSKTLSKYDLFSQINLFSKFNSKIEIQELIQNSPDCTPWFSEIRTKYLRSLYNYSFDPLYHPVSCICAISSEINIDDTIKTILSCYDQNNPPKFMLQSGMNIGILLSFVIIHDKCMGNEKNAKQILRRIDKIFGDNRCFLLSINSVAKNQPMNNSRKQLLNKHFLNYQLSKKRKRNKINEKNEKTKKKKTNTNNKGKGKGKGEEKTKEKKEKSNSHNNNNNNIHQKKKKKKTKKENENGEEIGCRLDKNDLNRIKTFTNLYVQNLLIPFFLKKIKKLNEEISNKRGFKNLFFDFIGGNNSSSNYKNKNKKFHNSLEDKIRYLGDLYFYIRDYEQAILNYKIASEEFKKLQIYDSFASSQFMIFLTTFLYSNRIEEQLLEQAQNTYKQLSLHSHRTIALWFHAEFSKTKGNFSTAINSYILLSTNNNDFNAALSLEQAAYCFLLNSSCYFRKFLFHLVLSGNRYSCCKQYYHSLRCFSIVFSNLQPKNYPCINEYLYSSLAKNCFLLKKYKQAILYIHQYILKSVDLSYKKQVTYMKMFLQYLKVYSNNNSFFVTNLDFLKIEKKSLNVFLLGDKLPNKKSKIISSKIWEEMKLLLLKEVKNFNNEIINSNINNGLSANNQRSYNGINNKTQNIGKKIQITTIAEPIIIKLDIKNDFKIKLILKKIHLIGYYGETINNHNQQIKKKSFSRLLLLLDSKNETGNGNGNENRNEFNFENDIKDNNLDGEKKIKKKAKTENNNEKEMLKKEQNENENENKNNKENENKNENEDKNKNKNKKGNVSVNKNNNKNNQQNENFKQKIFQGGNEKEKKKENENKNYRKEQRYMKPKKEKVFNFYQKLLDEEKNSNFVSEKIDLVLEPNSQKTIYLKIIPLKAGILQIYGIQYLFSNIMKVFHNFKLKGKRLNRTLIEKQNKIYSPNNKLTFRIIKKIPFIKIELKKFPQRVEYGMMYPCHLELNNAGNCKLKNLYLLVNPSDFFCMFNNEDNNNQIKIIQKNELYKISFNNFKSGNFLKLNCFIRASRVGSWNIRFLFYYDNASKNTMTKKYRTINFRQVLKVTPSIKINYRILPSAKKINTQILLLTIQNLSLKNLISFFQLIPISKNCKIIPFTIKNLQNSICLPPQLSPREIITFSFRIIINNNNNDDDDDIDIDSGEGYLNNLKQIINNEDPIHLFNTINHKLSKKTLKLHLNVFRKEKNKPKSNLDFLIIFKQQTLLGTKIQNEDNLQIYSQLNFFDIPILIKPFSKNVS